MENGVKLNTRGSEGNEPALYHRQRGNVQWERVGGGEGERKGNRASRTFDEGSSFGACWAQGEERKQEARRGCQICVVTRSREGVQKED